MLPAGSTIPATSPPPQGVTVDGTYFYAGVDPVHGTELWIQPTATLPAPPAAPSNLTATPVGRGQVKLTFSDNASDDSSLRIERSTDPNFATVDQTFVLVPGTAQYIDTRATGAATYYYRIYAVNLGGQSAYSSTAAASFGSISGQVFQDANHDGMQDSGETGLAGVSVYLDLNGNGLLDSSDPVAVTDANGVYTFANVAPGTYSVREMLPAGYGQTAPTTAAGSVAVTSLQNATGPTFGDVAISSITMDLSWLLTITRNFGKPGVFGTGDLNGDGTVNLADFLLLSRNFGHALPTGSAASAATSPSSNSAAATARRRATV